MTSEEEKPKGHRVALMVFMEAEGVDEHDASDRAMLALRGMIYEHGVKVGDMAPEMVPPSSTPPRCRCGARPGLTKRGMVRSHVTGEEGPVREAKWRCEGAGKPPYVDEHPIVVSKRGNYHMAARYMQVMDAGMAVSNGYVLVRPSLQAFR